jgi:hypothetical protein
VFADFVDLDDVRVSESCDRFGLGPEPGYDRRGAGSANHLERHDPIQPGVACAIDGPYSPGTEFAQDFESGDRYGAGVPSVRGLGYGLSGRGEGAGQVGKALCVLAGVSVSPARRRLIAASR